ncbi:MAG: orotate phosphoribosyltransferase [Elusimicrobia bacterium]|nr:orotate phosphoribosyltransferase [Elusimicrobiota bacterium]
MAQPNKLDVLGLLQEHGAIVSGHFKLSSGLHSGTYVQTALVLQYPHLAQRIARSVASKFPQGAEVVISPALGAVVIGQEVARAKKARAIFMERIGGAMTLRRDFRLDRGERALVVEDVLTTGRSTGEVVNLARMYGAHVLGVAAIVDRSIGDLSLSVPCRSLISYPLQVYPPDQCPLCERKLPLQIPGTGAQSSGEQSSGEQYL